VLPDGTQLTAASFDPAAPYTRVRDPDYGLYLDTRATRPWWTPTPPRPSRTGPSATRGAPGETAKTMIHGGTCRYVGGSQLAAAVAFLRAHRGHMFLVTIDVGANGAYSRPGVADVLGARTSIPTRSATGSSPPRPATRANLG
jgi:hypothetical protein